ncbi:pyocin knob domain-containing protein [Photorhabdus sp. RW14-46]|uniref:pyocin knob domain-containing protein n=1 Tax=Photorhabdus sp. RW14-46 TaxID=2100168 RepID=UPI0013F3EAE7|nr:pyocin knob domain-containing protein [Photorhabdus sp. RW14-46]
MAKGAVPNSRKVNGKVLTEDINITSQDIFNGQAISIPDKADLNDYQTPGLYYQSLNVQAGAGNNYPEPLAGSLVVLKNNAVTQRYFVYNSSRVYTRGQYHNLPWTPWAQEYNTLNKPTTSELGLIETVNLAKNSVPSSRKINGRALTNDISLNVADIGAMNVTSLGTIGNGSRFSNYVLSGFYDVTVSNPSSVPDFPLNSAGYLYGDGILEALNGGNVIFQRYTSHHGQEAARQSWDRGNTWGGWVPQLVKDSTLLETAGWIQDHNTGVITAWTTGEIATEELSMQVPLPITFPTGILNVQVSTKIPKYDVHADGFWQVIDWDKASVTVELQLVTGGAYNRQYRPMIYVVGY